MKWCLLVMLAAAPLSAQIPLSPRERAYRTLQQTGVSPESFEDDAKDNMRKSNMVVYDIQRLAVTGIVTVGSSADASSRDYDTILHPAFRNDDVLEARNRENLVQRIGRSLAGTDYFGALGRWIFSYGGEDLVAAAMETMIGKTKRVDEVFAGMRDKEVNELVAHSWGTELTYNAILNKKIRPPKLLIVAGVPDNSHQKWAMLARYTGTQVVFLSFRNDPIYGIAGWATTKASPRDLEKEWFDRCFVSNGLESLTNTCGVHNRTGQARIIREDGPDTFIENHFLSGYEERLKDLKYLDHSHEDMKAAQDEIIRTEARRLFDERLDRLAQEYQIQDDAAQVYRAPRPAPAQSPFGAPQAAPAQLAAPRAATVQEVFLEELQALAIKACASPDAGFTQRDLDRVNWASASFGSYVGACSGRSTCVSNLCRGLIEKARNNMTGSLSWQDVRIAVDAANGIVRVRPTDPPKGTPCFQQGSDPRGCVVDDPR
ncbi:MAG: hypothetical protein AB7Q29_13410 [Vicinamibacterales bacterium]